MRLPTISGDDVEYSDRPGDPTVLVEAHSAAATCDFDVLELEVSALCTASLLIQIRSGRRVAKILNLTEVVEGLANGSVSHADLGSLVNYLGRLVLDARFLPTTVTSAVVRRLDGALAAELLPVLDELGRIEKFVRAVGLDDSTAALAIPDIHVGLDRSRIGALAGGQSAVEWLAERSPFLAAQALWWDDSVGDGGERLTRPTQERWSMIDGEPVLFVPTRFCRSGGVPSRPGSSARLVEMTGAAGRVVGVTVATTPTANPVDQSAYESEMCAALIQHALDLAGPELGKVPSGAAATPPPTGTPRG